MRFRPTPATVLAGAALFFALGGSALALSDAVKPQPRCTSGAVRGIAAVTGVSGQGMANVPDRFTGSKALFSQAFNCAGAATQVRRVSAALYEVRFVGNRSSSAVVSSGTALATVEHVAGVFRVRLYVPGRDDEIDTPFVVVAV
jgi:hypothetical protein